MGLIFEDGYGGWLGGGLNRLSWVAELDVIRAACGYKATSGPRGWQVTSGHLD